MIIYLLTQKLKKILLLEISQLKNLMQNFMKNI